MRFFRRKCKPRYEDVDPMEFVRRAEAVQIRHEDAIRRAERACREQDAQTLHDAEAESDLLIANLRDLRLEQLACQQAGWKRRVDPSLGELRL